MNVRRLSGAAAGLFLLAAAGAACSSDESVENAEVGECIESLDDLTGGDVTEIPETECTEDHEAEIIFLYEHEGDDDDYPGAEELAAEANEECQGDVFEDYTGTPYEDSAILVNSLYPSEESWENGDRESICIAYTSEEVDVSFEDNGEDFLLADLPGGGDTGSNTTTTEGGDEEEDTSLEDFADGVEACEGGDLAACDDLYNDTPIGSQAEEIGATCGGEVEFGEIEPGTCEAELG